MPHCQRKASTFPNVKAGCRLERAETWRTACKPPHRQPPPLATPPAVPEAVPDSASGSNIRSVACKQLHPTEAGRAAGRRPRSCLSRGCTVLEGSTAGGFLPRTLAGPGRCSGSRQGAAGALLRAPRRAGGARQARGSRPRPLLPGWERPCPLGPRGSPGSACARGARRPPCPKLCLQMPRASRNPRRTRCVKRLDHTRIHLEVLHRTYWSFGSLPPSTDNSKVRLLLDG